MQRPSSPSALACQRQGHPIRDESTTMSERISALEQEIFKLERELERLRRRNLELEQQVQRYALQMRQGR